MDLVKPRRDIGRDHAFGLGHGDLGRLGPPRVRPKVIAAQHDPGGGAAFLGRDPPHQCREIAWCHAGIAALMVDLIAGRLDQHGGAGRRAVAQRRAQHQRMRRTDRGDAPRPAFAPQPGQIVQPQRHGAILGVAAMNASSSARVAAPSIGPRRITVRAPAAVA